MAFHRIDHEIAPLLWSAFKRTFSVASRVELDDSHIIHVKATQNNTICTVTESTGRVLCWASAGSAGFKHARRGTTFAAESAGAATAEKARALGITEAHVQIKGFGKGRTSSVKGLQDGGLTILSLTDVTPIPHNGCKPRKARRL